MGEFVECGDSSPYGSESGDESPHSALGELNDDQGPLINRTLKSYHLPQHHGGISPGGQRKA